MAVSSAASASSSHPPDSEGLGQAHPGLGKLRTQVQRASERPLGRLYIVQGHARERQVVVSMRQRRIQPYRFRVSRGSGMHLSPAVQRDSDIHVCRSGPRVDRERQAKHAFRTSGVSTSLGRYAGFDQFGGTLAHLCNPLQARMPLYASLLDATGHHEFP